MKGSDLEGTRYIVFRVNQEYYASPMLSIKEIVDPLPYCQVPNFHDYFLGLANLRGQIIGVIDLGLRLGKASSLSEDPGVMLICEDEGTTLGALVSCVESALTLQAAEIHVGDASISSSLPPEVYLGVVQLKERILPLVSLVQLLHAQDSNVSRAA